MTLKSELLLRRGYGSGVAPARARHSGHRSTSGGPACGRRGAAHHGRSGGRGRPGRIGAISLQSVYDALNVLVTEGLIRRIQPAGSPARFEDRVGDNHHHLICRICGRVVDVDCAVGDAPCLAASDDKGYQIDEAEIAYWGRCPDCQSQPPASTPPAPTQSRRRGSRQHEQRSEVPVPQQAAQRYVEP